jgi:hypothetical protein
MQQTEKLLWLWLTLSADVSRLQAPAKREKSHNSFYRRQYVRAAAALVEGFTSMMKQSALLHAEAFSSEEMLALREQEWLVQDGKVSVRKRFVPIKDNIRFAFNAYAKAMQAPFALDCSRSDWQDFQSLFAIRDRITHPKKHEELSIRDEELDSIKRALGFVSKNHSAVHETIQREMWSRKGLPEPLFKKWISWQAEACKAAHSGRLEKEWATLCERLDAEVEGCFGHVKSNGKG